MRNMRQRAQYRRSKRGRELQRAASRRHASRSKARVYDLLGRRCRSCGFKDERALQIDHINGTPLRAGEYARGGTSLYDAILNGRQPLNTVQVLCANCNWIKMRNNGEVQGYKRQRFSA